MALAWGQYRQYRMWARDFLGGASLVAGMLAGGPVQAQATGPTSQVGVATTLTSTDERMVSYRNQEHMWQTPDGYTHVMMNRGPTPENYTLVVQTTPDGVHWNASVGLPSTTITSTSDGYVKGDELYLTYAGTADDIRFAHLHYDETSKTWAMVGQPQVVYSSATVLGITPALVTDDAGTTWISFTTYDMATGNFNIKLMYKSQGETTDTAWADSGQVFAQTDGPPNPNPDPNPATQSNNERSARPVALPGGVGLVYTLYQDIYWAQHSSKADPTAPWKNFKIYTNRGPDSDPYGSHYNVVVDAQHNVHVFSVDGGCLVYSRFTSATNSWYTRFMTPDIDATYPKAMVANGNLVVTVNDESVLRVFQSSDGGNTFVNTNILSHPQASGSVSYSRPRIESPGHPVTNPVPILQQYVDGPMQLALYFQVPVVPVQSSDSSESSH